MNDERNLIRRYLIWCYKTTKEELDRIERKFTQLQVDEDILQYLRSSQTQVPPEIRRPYQQSLRDFRKYMRTKAADALTGKFLDPQKKIPQARYLYLKNRLTAVEKSIVRFLGKKELKAIRILFEEEMTNRILQARDQHNGQ